MTLVLIVWHSAKEGLRAFVTSLIERRRRRLVREGGKTEGEEGEKR